jgi:hypothetical protein
MARLKGSFLLCLVALAACDRPPVPPARIVPPKQPPPIPRMGEEEAVGIFKKTLDRHRDLFKRGICGNSSGWFLDEYSFYRTDGRMFARAFPTLAERLALELLNSRDAPQPDRLYAWFILEVLAPRTSDALEDFLTSQVNSLPDERREERGLALKNLIRRRFDDRTLALCRAQARKGSGTAIDALTTVVDPEAIRFFKEINSGEMLARIAVLQSKDWRETLWHILMGKKRHQYPLTFLWALEAAERQAMPELRSAVELRLQQIRKGTPPQRRWGSDDPDYDFLLLAWMRLGGALQPKEEAYLTFFGFLGDYEQRLRELQAERQGSRR